jgi:hypothetical protein
MGPVSVPVSSVVDVDVVEVDAFVVADVASVDVVGEDVFVLVSVDPPCVAEPSSPHAMTITRLPTIAQHGGARRRMPAKSNPGSTDRT